MKERHHCRGRITHTTQHFVKHHHGGQGNVVRMTHPAALESIQAVGYGALPLTDIEG